MLTTFLLLITMKSMHVSLVLLLLSVFGAVRVLSEDKTDQHKTWITKMFTNIREVVHKGVAAAHLPPLDPFHIGNVHISKNLIKGLEKYIDVSGALTNLTLTGLSSFTVSDVDFTLIPARIFANFHLPTLRFSGSNSLDGTIGGWVPLSGHGPFSVAAVNVTISIDAPLTNVNGFKVILADLKLKFNVQRFDTELVTGGGFMGGMANSVLSGTLKTIFDVFVPARFEEMGALLKHVINNALLSLYHKTLNQ